MQFHLQVQGPAGSQALAIDAASEAEAIRAAVRGGWRVLAVDAGATSDTGAALRPGKQGLPLLQFSQELLALLEAGLNLGEAMATLHNKETRTGAKATLAAIVLTLQQGLSFSDTLAGFPDIFPDIYIATVHAAERSGNLPEALARFVAYQLQFDAIRKKLISAAIYPCMLLVVGGLVTLFLLGYVVPKFSVVYESSGREIPWMSQMLLGFGQTLAAHPLLCAGALAAVVGAVVFGIANRAMRMALVLRLLRLPVLAGKAAEFRLARFYRALSLLLHAGIPLHKALAMVGPMLLPAQQEQLAQARRSVQEGMPFSTALEQAGMATPVAQSLLKVGENTGRLGDMLERSAKFHDEEFARWVDWASRLLEPLLMTIIGVVIGGVVVLMYMPIFELAGSLS
ncbi:MULTISPECIES: type II secretion system F family protein [unclassified Janthinobacterium]|uniref:type II secretion system F family protein n=1 Tax=unclassified Janthinobacterium TaxID=2610881 RepID=UPI001E3807ED|nr:MULTISPECIES: type II secretion system F family protein [unclassified Janthinobacterium]MCC7643523.1 type II secretion system F family protein [Janthinobacterium sp. EB271-G4-3-1]MCC7693592.1 type II secretion system F family protein [Janthinobacterium sp. EB271-G4-3-2]